jgi:zinc transport system substrate-binding protein
MENKDPHIWLSPKNAKIMVENICAGLITVDPDHSEYYTQNKNDYLQRLDELDRNIEDMLSGMENGYFMVYHPAWGYFARDYNLEQIAIERAGKEPTAQQIIESVEGAKSHNIKVIFASPEFSQESAETIAKEIGGRVVLISPLPENYIAEMYTLAGQLARPGETEAAGAQSQWWYWALAAGIGGVAIGAIGMYALAERRRAK